MQRFHFQEWQKGKTKVLIAAHSQKRSKYLVLALLFYSKSPKSLVLQTPVKTCGQTEETLICEQCWETHHTWVFLPEWSQCQSKTCPRGRVAAMTCVKQVVEQGWCTWDPTKHLVGRKIHKLGSLLITEEKNYWPASWAFKKKTTKKPKPNTPGFISSISSWLGPKGIGFVQNVSQSTWNSNRDGLNISARSTEVGEKYPWKYCLIWKLSQSYKWGGLLRNKKKQLIRINACREHIKLKTLL